MLREDSGEAREGGACNGDPEYGAEPAPDRPGEDDHKPRRGDQHRRGDSEGGLGRRAGDRRARHDLAGRHLPTVGEFFGRVTGSARGTRGVSTEVGETQAAIDLTVTVPYGRSIPEVTKAMRDNVIQHVENMTGLEVTEVNITMKDVFLSEQR